MKQFIIPTKFLRALRIFRSSYNPALESNAWLWPFNACGFLLLNLSVIPTVHFGMKKILSIRFAAIFSSLWVKMNEINEGKYSSDLLGIPQKRDEISQFI